MNLFGNVWEETAAFISRAGEDALSSALDEAASFSRTLSYVQNYTVSHCRWQYSLRSQTWGELHTLYTHKMFSGNLVVGIQAPTCGSLDIEIYKYFFLCKYFRHFNPCGSLALDIQDFFAALCHSVVWYFFFYFCSCFCVYIEIVALVWNSYANSMVGENIVKYTSRMWNIK
jgi:hypothetical protein